MPRPTRRWTAAAAFAVGVAISTPALASAQSAPPNAQPGARQSAYPDAAPTAPTVPASTATRPSATDFSSIVALSNCSGSIVRWQTSQPTDKAMMLTNGHCYGDHFLGAHEVVVNKPAVRTVTLLAADGSDAGNVSTVQVLYATMSRTDVSLYQLSQTYQDLQRTYDVPAITIASTKPISKHQSISIISGYWKTEYDCNLHGFAYRLHEYVWTWNRSLRYSNGGCQIIGGTSGSPVLDKSRTMIGINNTINADGERCTLDNPCEENRAGKVTVHENRGYGQETWVFYTCLTHNQIDLSKSGCMLPKP